jgi:hypothetical protein
MHREPAVRDSGFNRRAIFLITATGLSKLPVKPAARAYDPFGHSRIAKAPSRCELLKEERHRWSAAVSNTRLDLTAQELRKAASAEKDGAAARRTSTPPWSSTVLAITSPMRLGSPTTSPSLGCRPAKLKWQFSPNRSCYLAMCTGNIAA